MSTQVAEQKERSPLQALQDQIMGDHVRQQLQMALPEHISVEKFQRVVMTAVNKAPDLINGDRASLFTACVECAQDGLLPNGKEAALVIYNTKQDNQWIKKVQYMPMIQGIYRRARNSGEIVTLNAHLVCQNDDFDYQLGFEPKLDHKPALGDRGEVVFVYAVAVMKDGTRDLEIMTKAEVEEVRAASKASGNGPWVSWWGEMARKTVVRRLAKRLPVSSDLDRVISRMDAMYEFDERKKGPAPSRPSRMDATDSSYPAPDNVDMPAEDIFTLTDEHGETVGGFNRSSFVAEIVSAIDNCIQASVLTAFWEFNEDAIANLGDARTDSDRQTVTKAYHEAKARLAQDDQQSPPPPPAASRAADTDASKQGAADPHFETFEAVKKAVSEAETGVDLVNAWAAQTTALNALKEAHPDKYDELDSFYVGREAKLQREAEPQSTEAAE